MPPKRNNKRSIKKVVPVVTTATTGLKLKLNTIDKVNKRPKRQLSPKPELERTSTKRISRLSSPELDKLVEKWLPPLPSSSSVSSRACSPETQALLISSPPPPSAQTQTQINQTQIGTQEETQAVALPAPVSPPSNTQHLLSCDVDCIFRAIGPSRKTPFFQRNGTWTRDCFSYDLVRRFQERVDVMDLVKSKRWKLETVTAVTNKTYTDVDEKNPQAIDLTIDREMFKRKGSNLKNLMPDVFIDLQYAVDRSALSTSILTSTSTAPLTQKRGRLPVVVDSDLITTAQDSADSEGQQMAAALADIKRRWPCTLEGCRGWKAPLRLCYLKEKLTQEPKNHLLVTEGALKYWAQMIVLKQASYEKPNAGTSLLLRKGGNGLPLPKKKRVRDIEGHINATPQQPQLPPFGVPISSPYGWLYGGFPPPYLPQQQQQQQWMPQPSPQLQNPPSSPSQLRRSVSPSSQISAFFSWIRRKYPREGLQDTEAVLIREAWDLVGLRHELTTDDWRSMDLKSGEFGRVKRYLKEYKNSGFGADVLSSISCSSTASQEL